MKPYQFDLPSTSGVFNLAGARGQDGDRVVCEAAEAEQRRAAAREFEARMQRKLSECPGVVGFDAPRSSSSSGRVVVEPRLISEAVQWLRRRFIVNESLELDLSADGLVLEVQPRQRRASKHHARPVWAIEQFTLRI